MADLNPNCRQHNVGVQMLVSSSAWALKVYLTAVQFSCLPIAVCYYFGCSWVFATSTCTSQSKTSHIQYQQSAQHANTTKDPRENLQNSEVSHRAMEDLFLIAFHFSKCFLFDI